MFTTQLEKSRESTDASNIRGYYAEITTALLSGDLTDAVAAKSKTYVGSNLEATVSGLSAAKAENDKYTVTVADYTPVQTTENWQSGDITVAGAEIKSTDNLVGNSNIVFTFTIGADLDAYLSGITFS